MCSRTLEERIHRNRGRPTAVLFEKLSDRSTLAVLTNTASLSSAVQRGKKASILAEPGKARTAKKSAGGSSAMNRFFSSFVPSVIVLFYAANIGAYLPSQSTSFNVSSHLTDLTCSVDQSINLQKASVAAGAGAELRLPAGCIKFGASTITLLPGQHVIGEGNSGPTAQTGTLLYASGNSGIGLILVGDGASIEKIALKNTTAPNNDTPVSASAAIGIQQGNGENPQNQLLRDVVLVGFSTGIDVHDGNNWTHDHLLVTGALTYNYRIRNLINGDQGDWSIDHSTISNCNGKACLRMESDSGGRISNTKFISGGSDSIGIDVNIVTTTQRCCSDLAIASTVSIENFNGPAISLASTGGTVFANITVEAQISTNYDGIVVGHNVANLTVAPSCHIISGGHAVTVAGNANTRNINLAPTVDASVLSAIYITGGSPINYDTRFIHVNHKPGISVLVEDTRSGAGFGNETHLVRCGIAVNGLASSSAYVTVASLQLPIFSGGAVELDFNGIVEGVDASSFSRKLMFRRGAGAAALVATLYDSGVSGAPVDFQAVTTSADGIINFNFRRNAAGGGTQVRGRVDMDVKGSVARLEINNFIGD